MSEATQRTGQDHSKFDNMSTAELNEYLRQDAERDDSDLDDVLYIMEVLAKREKEENNDNLPDVRKHGHHFRPITTPPITTGDPCTTLMMRPRAKLRPISQASKARARA